MPHIPDFPGIERFPGRVLHAHDFRDKNEFLGKTLLLIGSSYSAEDIAVQYIKYGASEVTITWRSNHWSPNGRNRWRRSRLSRGLRGGWLTSKRKKLKGHHGDLEVPRPAQQPEDVGHHHEDCHLHHLEAGSVAYSHSIRAVKTKTKTCPSPPRVQNVF